jgi:hypothetical protein
MSKRQVSHVITAGASLVLAPRGAPWSLGVTPEAGATVTVEASVTPASAITDAAGTGALWHALGEPLTEAALIAFPGPVTALRVSAADAGATIELVS